MQSLDETDKSAIDRPLNIFSEVEQTHIAAPHTQYSQGDYRHT